MSLQWSFYRLSDGHFTGKRLLSMSGKKQAHETLTLNTPEGCAAIEGHFDRLSQRVDLETRQVVDYVPQQPDADHEWHVESKRWRKRADVAEREQRRTETLAQIADLEQRQARPLRELVRNPTNAEARFRIDQVDIEIAKLREQLKE